MDISSIQDWVTLILAIITAASVIVKGVAMLTQITPGTNDNHVVGTLEKVLHRIQKVLGTISFDSSKHKMR